ncbi:hypothetical protein DEU56DRAFT_824028 [Suillus clintonianus]|uniref:uncharacterized protein n=1 Tax=Suillus clintonianus TaxID=1904413 RepID=UPI001B87C3AC|nr:uncharacterized protein DEU56DRAFT_824028 [Suillus clintonianus]KAG2125720.1 hypothetical protein DEU56DRAFT_824028 [Suillus clintonianus]
MFFFPFSILLSDSSCRGTITRERSQLRACLDLPIFIPRSNPVQRHRTHRHDCSKHMPLSHSLPRHILLSLVPLGQREQCRRRATSRTMASLCRRAISRSMTTFHRRTPSRSLMASPLEITPSPHSLVRLSTSMEPHGLTRVRWLAILPRPRPRTSRPLMTSSRPLSIIPSPQTLL